MIKSFNNLAFRKLIHIYFYTKVDCLVCVYLSELVFPVMHLRQYHVTVFLRHHWILQLTRACYRVSHSCSVAEQPSLV